MPPLHMSMGRQQQPAFAVHAMHGIGTVQTEPQGLTDVQMHMLLCGCSGAPMIRLSRVGGVEL
jgi:hypothetical protein